MWRLEQRVGAEGKEAVVIYAGGGRHTVGRKGTAIVIEDKSVSREHGFIDCGVEALVVGEHRKASRYGTFVNGAQVAGGATVRVADGDVIRFGGQETGVSDFVARRHAVRVCCTMCGRDDKDRVAEMLAQHSVNRALLLGRETGLVACPFELGVGPLVGPQVVLQ